MMNISLVVRDEYLNSKIDLKYMKNLKDKIKQNGILNVRVVFTYLDSSEGIYTVCRLQ